MSTPYRTCSTCGVQLVPGQPFCSNCGTSQTDTSMIDPTQRASYSQPGSSPSQAGFPYSQPGSSPSQAGFPYSQPGSSPSQAGFPYSQPGSSPSQANFPYSQPGSSPSQPSFADSSQQAFNATQKANTSYGGQGQSMAPPPPQQFNSAAPPYNAGQMYPQYPQPPSQPKKKNNVLLIVGGILAVVLIACVGLSYAVIKALPNSSPGTSTPTASAYKSTPTSVPTSAPAPKVLFTDNFANNNNNWIVGQNTGFGSSVSNNTLAMSEANHKFFQEPIPNDNSYTDFTVTTTFTMQQGDQNDFVGVQIRAGSTTGTDAERIRGYYAGVNGDNTYSIYKFSPDPNDNTKNKYHDVAVATSSSAIHPLGQQNTMTVVAKGSALVLSINNTVVTTVHDDSFTSGPVELVVENGDTSQGVKAIFNNITVTEAPSQLPG